MLHVVKLCTHLSSKTFLGHLDISIAFGYYYKGKSLVLEIGKVLCMYKNYIITIVIPVKLYVLDVNSLVLALEMTLQKDLFTWRSLFPYELDVQKLGVYLEV